jgi:hypothetical protein
MNTKLINWNRYHEMWDDANDNVERRVLYLGLRLELDASGWTIDCYSKRDLLRIMQYAWGRNYRHKVDAAIDRLTAKGVLKTRVSSEDPYGRQHLWFDFAAFTAQDGVDKTCNAPAEEQSDLPHSEIEYVENIFTPEDVPQHGEAVSRSGDDLPHTADTIPQPSDPTQSAIYPKNGSDVPCPHARASHDSHEFKKDSMSNESHESSQSEVFNLQSLLVAVGIDANAHFLAEDWTVEQLSEIIERAKYQQQQGKIRTTLAQYIVGCLKRGPNQALASSPNKSATGKSRSKPQLPKVNRVPDEVPLSPLNQKYAKQAIAGLAKWRQEHIH